MDTGTSPDGLLNSAKSLLGGESAFANEFTAKAEQGTVTFAPPPPGDILSHEFRDETLYSTDGPFLAASYGINIDAELGGLKSMLEEASQTPSALKGVGTAFIDAYGLGETRIGSG